MSAEQRLAGRVAIVTGAGSGIGRAEAISLARAGAAVAVNSVGTDEAGRSTADVVVAEIEAEGGRAVAVREDLRDPAAPRAIVDAALDAFGRLDILVNNAATAHVSPIDEVTDERWAEVLDVSLTATFRLIRHAAPVFRRQRRGVIVNTGSESGLGHAYMSAYAAAKEAVIGLTRSVARELGPDGVRCNAVRPRALGTKMGERYRAEMAPYFDRWARLGPLRVGVRAGIGGAGDAWSVAPLVVWLCTDAASNVNGCTFAVEGDTVGLWSEPELRSVACRAGGWDLDALDQVMPASVTLGLEDRFAPQAAEVPAPA
ncbi:NAD(P)-dependent dehydrogenase, short-chain alcohol dehydrogenase family [Pseudonocardia thermophila]|jgi:Dehydrogenases with different specificities (related to short-chain alcohol dehydrogenases)|uniref:NAD(P)-dependent dehydrogenase, short-chain alcohol dehydrogenase family n=1 Tax=Pseudonocardia thermophila TaxID=1848 RepID=A0A1M6Q5I2_PSETH|nr:SDR family NAD(P)-dependent oxidoreductase [Pseudonocardia thermophila]SHK15445.1 NAD(P)-dependent dehydrogenase, short-chain alcohol dehydrogenase family [Pseudonocardia thermophila]